MFKTSLKDGFYLQFLRLFSLTWGNQDSDRSATTRALPLSPLGSLAASVTEVKARAKLVYLPW